MDYSEILTLVFKCLGALLAGGILTIIPKVKEWLVTKVGEKKAADIYALIETFVEAAEQTLKADDPTGQIRKQYVEERLMELGYEVTNAVNAYIESAVFNLPKVK